MKINDFINGTKGSPYTGGASAPKDKETARAAEGQQAPVASGDKVQISARSREIARVGELVQNAPAVRAEKVAEVKTRVENGSYEVKAEDVAEKVLLSSLSEKL